MTEYEAIRELKADIEICSSDNEGTCKNFVKKEYAYECTCVKAVALKALEEIQQYKKYKEIFEAHFSKEALELLSDKEEFSKWLERGKWIAKKCEEINKELEEYHKLGTVEELKAVMIREILRRRGEGKIFIILNTQEAKKWVEKIYLLPLESAVHTGLLIPIDNGYYVVKETVTNQCTWVIEEVRKLTAEEMAENNLYLPYRLTARVTECPDDYEGVREISAGFDLH